MTVYLDNAASTPVLPAISESYARIAAESYANASAMHAPAWRLRQELARINRDLLTTLGSGEEEADVIWTSGGTEANNLAVLGVLNRGGGGDALTTTVEHASVTAALQASGIPFDRVGVDRHGAIDLGQLDGLLTPQTRLVSICQVQSETGNIHDLAAAAALVRRRSPRAVLHVDGVQAFGKLPIPWQQAGIDLLSVSGHKIHAPGGVGALICRRGVELSARTFGGGQQRGLRSGSLDGIGIRCFHLAAMVANNERDARYARVAALRQQLGDGLCALKLAELQMVSSPGGSPYIVNFTMTGYQGAVLARLLSEREVFVGTGSACAAESKDPSAVLTAMGVPRDAAWGALRVSFGEQNTAAEIAHFLTVFAEVVADY